MPGDNRTQIIVGILALVAALGAAAIASRDKPSGKTNAGTEAQINGCPGNLLNGEHRPRGHEPWTWALDSRLKTARVFKPNHEVTGEVEMNCTDGKWSAALFGMTHGVIYNCVGDVDGGKIRNATCQASVPPTIDVTGVFSTSAK